MSVPLAVCNYSVPPVRFAECGCRAHRVAGPFRRRRSLRACPPHTSITTGVACGRREQRISATLPLPRWARQGRTAPTANELHRPALARREGELELQIVRHLAASEGRSVDDVAKRHVVLVLNQRANPRVDGVGPAQPAVAHVPANQGRGPAAVSECRCRHGHVSRRPPRTGQGYVSRPQVAGARRAPFCLLLTTALGAAPPPYAPPHVCVAAWVELSAVATAEAP